MHVVWPLWPSRLPCLFLKLSAVFGIVGMICYDGSSVWFLVFPLVCSGFSCPSSHQGTVAAAYATPMGSIRACHCSSLAAQGRVAGLIGGPPCKTYSASRHHDAGSDGPRPLRGTGEDAYGLPGLSQCEQAYVDQDTLLYLKHLYLAAVVMVVSDWVCHGVRCWSRPRTL